jgi:hypothetical protein
LLRRLLYLLVTASLACFIVSSVGWWQSFYWTDLFDCSIPGKRVYVSQIGMMEQKSYRWILMLHDGEVTFSRHVGGSYAQALSVPPTFEKATYRYRRYRPRPFVAMSSVGGGVGGAAFSRSPFASLPPPKSAAFEFASYRPEEFDLRFPLWIVCAGAGTLTVLTGWMIRRVRYRNRLGACRQCGYSTTGNISGVCPECGTSLRIQ